MEYYSDNHAYITLKDHKENFRNNIKCRLINPSKGEVGLVSKRYLSNTIAEYLLGFGCLHKFVMYYFLFFSKSRKHKIKETPVLQNFVIFLF